MSRLAPAALLCAVLATFCPSSARAGPTSSHSPASLCRVPEKDIFTCGVGTRTVSICGTPQDGQLQDDQGQGGSVYRFGRLGHVELEITGLHRTQTMFPGGGETQVYADTATHRYVVYDQMVRTGYGPEGHNDPRQTEGLLVQKGGRIVSNRICAGAPAFDTRLLGMLPQANYIPH